MVYVELIPCDFDLKPNEKVKDFWMFFKRSNDLYLLTFDVWKFLNLDLSRFFPCLRER